MGELKPVVNLASSTLFWRINLTGRQKCGRILVMSLDKVITGVVLSEVAVAEIPQLRPLAPIAHAATAISLLLLLEELLRQPAH